jgi:hypothetical protein
MRAQLFDGRVGELARRASSLGPHLFEPPKSASRALGVADGPLAHRIEPARGSLVTVMEKPVDRRARGGAEDPEVLAIGGLDAADRMDHAVPLANPAQPVLEDALLRAEGQKRRVDRLRVESSALKSVAISFTRVSRCDPSCMESESRLAQDVAGDRGVESPDPARGQVEVVRQHVGAEMGQVAKREACSSLPRAALSSPKPVDQLCEWRRRRLWKRRPCTMSGASEPYRNASGIESRMA